MESETTRVSEEHTDSPAAPRQPSRGDAGSPPKKKKGALLRALREQNEMLARQNEALAAQLTRQDATLSQLSSTVAALAAREPAPAPATKAEEDAEVTQLIRDARREVNARVLAAIRGEDPAAEKAVGRALGQVRQLLKDVGEVKTLAEEASLTLGGGKALTPEPDLAESMEKFANAAERVSNTRVGAKLLNKLGLGDAAANTETPALEHKPTDEEVNAAYG